MFYTPKPPKSRPGPPPAGSQIRLAILVSKLPTESSVSVIIHYKMY